MPRGLSDLQKRVLLIVYGRRMARDLDREREEHERKREEYERKHAAHKHIQEGPFGFGLSWAEWTPRQDIHMWELLAEVWGWPPRENIYWNGQRFSVRDIGEAEYNRGTTILYRSVARLRRRGLIEAHRGRTTEYKITDEGIRVAERLSVESGDGSSPLLTNSGA